MYYANDFNDILIALRGNRQLREHVLELILEKPILGKSIEEFERVNEFRTILVELINGDIDTLEKSYTEVKARLPKENSKYKKDNDVFAKGWAERLVRTQLSRFYNQGLLENLANKGVKECLIPQSTCSCIGSKCVCIENGQYNVIEILKNIVNNYDLGYYDDSLKLPEHPYCTHVVKPL